MVRRSRQTEDVQAFYQTIPLPAQGARCVEPPANKSAQGKPPHSATADHCAGGIRKAFDVAVPANAGTAHELT